jgi:pyridinium-3,5-bisthiocarboxylic acid mononucleotide nickel chelatase
MNNYKRNSYPKGLSMKIAYFECLAGAAGDMITAAMLDAGLDNTFLISQLKTLDIGNFDIQITRVKRNGLSATYFKPICSDSQSFRNLQQITEIIKRSKISSNAKQTAIAIFNKLAAAEAAVHGKDPNEIHFHEVGAFDSIVDIVSAAIGIETLGIEKIYCSTLSLGSGTVKCDHGLLPVPAPATAELVKGFPVRQGPIEAELLTPTAAAILTTIVDQFTPMPPAKLLAIGSGAGSMDSTEIANITRLFIAETAEESSAEYDSVCLLETNIDDTSAEIIASVIDMLFEAGALDVFTSAINMKQNRPAVKFSILCKPQDSALIEQVIFQQGLTFGIRKQLLQRTKLSRTFQSVITEFGDVKIKIGSLGDKTVNIKPEFKDCLELAKKHKLPVKTVILAAMQAYKDHLGK